MEKIIEGFSNDPDLVLLSSNKNCYIYKDNAKNYKMIITFDDTDKNKMSIEFEELDG